MFPNSFSLGPLTFHIYGLIIAAAILIGWWLAKKRVHFYKIDPNLLDSPLILLPLILGIIGGRLYHVADFWSYYRNNPAQIFNISGGGLGIFGAIIGIFAGFWLFARIKKTKLLPLLDLLSPSLILGQAIGRIGNYINQEGFGKPTDLPWGVFIKPENRPIEYLESNFFHPTFFYEGALNLIAFLILIFLSSLSSSPLNSHSRESGNQLRVKLQGSRFSIWSRMTLQKPGQIFVLYLISYSAIRFTVEFWRIDTARIGQLQIAHVISLVVFCVGIYLITSKDKKWG